MDRAIIRPPKLRGEIRAPGDKSITHRAFILNTMATGVAEVVGYSDGNDCMSTLKCVQALGAEVEVNGKSVRLSSPGLYGLENPKNTLDAGNSGTTMRLLAGLLSAVPFASQMTGDSSLLRRPMDRIIEPLGAMGARIKGSGERGVFAPLEIMGGSLNGISYEMPIASAQVKSALLIAGLSAKGETVVIEPVPSRDHTERMLGAMGADIHIRDNSISIRPSTIQSINVTVPGDFSSAAYWIAAGCLHPDADVVVRNVGVNRYRTGLIRTLLEMGADIVFENEAVVGGELVADIRARTSRLKGVEVMGSIIPWLVDELPIVALIGAFADGTTTIRDATELRVKETDRIQTTTAQLSKMGIAIEELFDGMLVRQSKNLNGTTVSSCGDHRLAMTLGIAGLLMDGQTIVREAEAASVTYPGFWADLDMLSGVGS